MAENIVDTKLRVLVVDDSSTMRRIVKTALRDIGMRNIVMAEDGDEAWDTLQNDTIDLVLSDHKMPRMSGEEFLKLVRADERYKTLPFIMVTAEAFRDNVMNAVKLGVSNYIVKPFSASQLQDKIEKVLGGIFPERDD